MERYLDEQFQHWEADQENQEGPPIHLHNRRHPYRPYSESRKIQLPPIPGTPSSPKRMGSQSAPFLNPAEFSTFSSRRPSTFAIPIQGGMQGFGANEDNQQQELQERLNRVQSPQPATSLVTSWSPPKPRPTKRITRREVSESQSEITDTGQDGVYIRFPWKNKRKSKRRRVIRKDGDCNIQYKNVSERRRRYIYDLYTTLVDSSWTDSLILFAMSFYVAWTSFAGVYYFICWKHGDFLEENLPANQESSGWKPCVLEMENFASAFLFSLETQHTIGYGSRQTTNVCVEAIVVMSMQSVIGCLIQAFMVGLVFAKISRPVNRRKTVIFSKQAVICERDGKLCMVFRVGDMRYDSFIVKIDLSVKVIRRRCTQEGEMYHDISTINLQPDTAAGSCVMVIWPICLIHEIDSNSPFYGMTASEIANDKFEIVLCMEGTIESTSMTFQARTSYLPQEILWGHRFEPMTIYRRDTNTYQVNFSAFDSTYEVDTPLCSAKDLERFYSQESHTELNKFDRNPFRTVPSSLQECDSGGKSDNKDQVPPNENSDMAEKNADDDGRPEMVADDDCPRLNESISWMINKAETLDSTSRDHSES